MYLTQSLPPASLGPLFWAWRGCRCRGPAEFAVLVSGNGQVVIPSAGSRLQGRPQHRSQLQIHSVNQLYSNTLDSILKNRDITLLTKVHLVKAMVFPIVMYGCENWTIKKAERQRIDAFELWCWRRLLRVPWTARRSNQSILKEISPEYSLEGLMLKLKLQYFGHLMRRTDLFEKILMLGKTEGGRRRGRPRMRWLDVHGLDGHEFE